jgi:chromosomal replication initiator protein
MSTDVDAPVETIAQGRLVGLVNDPQRLWEACAQILRTQVSDAVWLMSFQTVQPVSLDGDHLVLAVPSSVARERIESRYLGLVEAALDDAGFPGVSITLDVHRGIDTADEEISAWLDDPDVGVTSAPTQRTERAEHSRGASAPEAETDEAPSHARYTFEAFVTGGSNRFAHAAALSVAETPGKAYNPLFIYGDAGLGKTHLLQAISHYVAQHYPTYIVRYISTETFMNQFVEALRTKTPLADFKKYYREVDVLLVDDIQFMEGKESLQEEFFHTFNALHQANRQIVLSSDRPPDSIATLEDRLRSRFKSGLITDIQPPELETRIAILRKKAEHELTPVPPEVLEFIATHITDNIRELEGAMIRVSAYASLTGEQLSVELAGTVLSDVLRDNQPRPITPKLILEKTSDQFGFSIDEITGKSRRRPLVTARQVGMYVFRELTDLSYPAIAREFGNRDHTTVIHAVEKIGALMKERRQIYDQVTELSESIRNGSR